MLLSQGFEIGENDELIIPEGTELAMRIPTELIPYCPDDGELMTTNLRADDKFVEDDGWHIASDNYARYLEAHSAGAIVFLELGVGANTPGIIKYPFWKMTHEWNNAIYACINLGEAYVPNEIKDKSIAIDGDIEEILDKLKKEST